MATDTSIYLSIVAKNHDEFVAKISELYHGFCAPVVRGVDVSQMVADAAKHADTRILAALGAVESEVPGARAAAEADALAEHEGPKQQRRRGRPRKNETQEAAALAPATEAAPAADVTDMFAATAEPAASVSAQPSTPVSKEQVKDALNAYVGAHSMPAGRELVQKVCGVDVLSLSQIPEDKYAAVVAACKVA